MRQSQAMILKDYKKDIFSSFCIKNNRCCCWFLLDDK